MKGVNWVCGIGIASVICSIVMAFGSLIPSIPRELVPVRCVAVERYYPSGGFCCAWVEADSGQRFKVYKVCKEGDRFKVSRSSLPGYIPPTEVEVTYTEHVSKYGGYWVDTSEGVRHYTIVPGKPGEVRRLSREQLK